MPFVPVPNSALVEVRFLNFLQHVENTLWFNRADAPDVANLTALATAVKAWWLAQMKPLQPTSVLMNEVVATDMSSATGPQVSIPAVTGDQGVVSSPSLPNNCSLAVSFRTASRGRSFRGRNYIPALWEQGVDDNTVQPTIVAAIQLAYEQLIIDTGIAAAGWTWGIASRFHGVDAQHKPIPRATGIFTPIVSVVIVDPTVDSARRRLPGRGR